MDEKEITEIALKVHRIIEQQKRKNLMDGKVLATRSWLDEHYGQSVMKAVLKLGLVFPYAFGTREMTDPEGMPVTLRKGADYYRVSDVERAIEDMNIYKSLRENYRKREMSMKEIIRDLRVKMDC